jgi:hypothetical protein
MKKMKTKLILLCCLSCLFFACEDTTNNGASGSLEVTFKARYGTRPLVMYQKYPYYKGLPMKIQAFSFFVNNLRWASKGTSSKPENEVSLVDFGVTNTDSLAAEKGITLKYDGLPIGSTTIAFDVGVPKSINAKQPKDFDAKNNLSDGSYYWESWKSFIFTKLEGRVDTSGKGQYKNTFSYHTGLDESFRSITLPGTVTITEGATTRLLIEVDSKTIFGLAEPPIDVVKKSESHSAAAKDLMITLSDNYKFAFRVK